nr:PREDICTED: astakine-like [Megachile rotundata]XP_012153357.1 PREDICTED: astakine-like [Megachile rotundata]
MTPIFVTLFLLFVLSCSSRAQTNRPDYIQCQSNAECDSGYCCNIGPLRYSIPQCKVMQAEGEICRPGSTSPTNMTLGYPDGALVTLTNVHYILCPCANGLTCDTKEGICKDTGEGHDTNRLFEEHKRHD